MPHSQCCVLVLDADEATRSLYERMLSDQWRMIGCATEGEAHSLLDAMVVDALVVEPTTLKDDEWDFLSRVRHSHPQMPVVVCSTLDARRKGARQGVVAYLIKPVSPLQLAATLREVLATAGATRKTRTEAASTEDLEQ